MPDETGGDTLSVTVPLQGLKSGLLWLDKPPKTAPVQFPRSFLQEQILP